MAVYNQEVYIKTLQQLLTELHSLREFVVSGARRRLTQITPLPNDDDDSRRSIENLVNYLTLRSQDLRPLQARLSEVGLSSLGRCEPHVLANIDRLIAILTLAVASSTAAIPEHTPQLFNEGADTLKTRTNHLFGAVPKDRDVRIMVTMPTEAAHDKSLVRQLLMAGMDCARINCAHDDAEVWRLMVQNIRQVAAELERECKILMDLAGYKIRTGRIEHKALVRRIKVEKDELGRVISPATIKIQAYSAAAPLSEHKPKILNEILLPDALYEQLKDGDQLVFVDARNKPRTIDICFKTQDGTWIGRCELNAYIPPGMTLRLCRNIAGHKLLDIGEFQLGESEGVPQSIRLFTNDHLLLTKQPLPGEPAKYDDYHARTIPAHISCSIPEVVDALRTGHSVWIDDGKLGGTVESITEDGVLIKIQHAGPKGVRVREDKGLNFPDSKLSLPALSPKDYEDLDTVCEIADMVGFSFVQSKNDMQVLLSELHKRNAYDLPVIAKIETQLAVRNLADIILNTLGKHPLGIMIARGDLAVELGSERMAEIQEEILWICEAAHVPAIWATQVLESLAKKGITSRPEITDAAMSVRAECVMLNKGPYVANAVRVLSDILRRMQAHQHKKISRMRGLHF